MSVYLYTFRTDHRNAWLDSKTFVAVYAMKYLCHAGDEDDGFGRSNKRAKLLRTNIDGCTSRFNQMKPTHIALVHENDWENAVVHINPTSAVWYDTDPFTAGGVVGFLKRQGTKWVISPERTGSDTPGACGLKVTRNYVERVVDGKIARTNVSYVFTNGTTFTEEQFEAWKAVEEPKYLLALQNQRDQQAEEARVRAAAKQEKLTAKDAEIATAEATLSKLRQERQQILTYA